VSLASYFYGIVYSFASFFIPTPLLLLKTKSAQQWGKTFILERLIGEDVAESSCTVRNSCYHAPTISQRCADRTIGAQRQHPRAASGQYSISKTNSHIYYSHRICCICGFTISNLEILFEMIWLPCVRCWKPLDFICRVGRNEHTDIYPVMLHGRVSVDKKSQEEEHSQIKRALAKMCCQHEAIHARCLEDGIADFGYRQNESPSHEQTRTLPPCQA